MIREAEVLNEQTLREIKFLRKEMGESGRGTTKGGTVPLEIVHPGE